MTFFNILFCTPGIFTMTGYMFYWTGFLTVYLV
jgi:hypothetical protein